jgi:hypothetical protein
MTAVPLARVLPGANKFSEGNVNATFRGQVLLEDGQVAMAIIKDLEIRELANELLASVLGKYLGLPVPDVAIGLASAADLPVVEAPQLNDGQHLVFVSRDMGVPNLKRSIEMRLAEPAVVDMIINDLKSWDHLGALYAFDTWVANIDRHAGNLLFGGKSDVNPIDHGWCFSGPDWQPSDLHADRAYRHKLSEWMTALLTPKERRERSADAMGCANAMAQVDVAAAATDSRIANLLPDADVQAVAGFLRQRVASVPRHTNAALGLPSLL